MVAFFLSDAQAQRGGPGGGRGMPSPDELWAMYGGGPDGIIVAGVPVAAIVPIMPIISIVSIIAIVARVIATIVDLFS